MNVYMDELPYNCDCCPCNDDCYRCGLSGDLFDEHDIDIGRMKNCKLKRLADVRENVRGEWLSGDCMGASCSKCGEYFSFRTFSEVHNFNFCPNCGADMRGDNNEMDSMQ